MLTRPTLLLSALLLLATPGCRARRVEYGGVYGNVHAPQVAASAGTGWGWNDVAVQGTGLSCRFPTQARYTQRVGREPDGAFYRTRSARAEVPYGVFGVSITEWEGGLVGDPLEVARRVADDIFSTAELRDRRTQRLDIAGFYGREDVGIAPDGVFVALRQFVGQRRIYLAIATVANAPGPLGTAERFMTSIRIDTADAILPVGHGAEPAPMFMPETDFAVRMLPVSSRRSEDLDLGERRVPMQSFVSDGPGVRLRVRVIEVTGGVEPEMLEQIADRLSLGQRRDPVSCSGFPGANFAERASGNVVIRARLFVTANRVYVLESASRPAQSHDPIIETFFDSFRIL